MNIKEIQELIKFVSKSGVNEVSIEQENFKITIKTVAGSGGGQIQGQQPYLGPVGQSGQPYYQVQGIPQYQGAAGQNQPTGNLAQGNQTTGGAPGATDSEKSSAADASRYLTIKSPMIGTFYRTPGPDKPAFVSPGDEVTAGKTVCIIEAMKLFNDIESEISGRIVKVLVENSSPVEYDQPLFLVEPI